MHTMNTLKYRVFDRFGNEIDPADDAVLPDGCTVRVPMLMQDSMQRAIAADTEGAKALAENAAASQRTLDALHTQAQGVQRHADHYTIEAARRDHELTRNGYSASLNFAPTAPLSID